MVCECDACLEDVETPPIEHEDPSDIWRDMAWDACWQDMADFE